MRSERFSEPAEKSPVKPGGLRALPAGRPGSTSTLAVRSRGPSVQQQCRRSSPSRCPAHTDGAHGSRRRSSHVGMGSRLSRTFLVQIGADPAAPLCATAAIESEQPSAAAKACRPDSMLGLRFQEVGTESIAGKTQRGSGSRAPAAALGAVALNPIFHPMNPLGSLSSPPSRLRCLVRKAIRPMPHATRARRLHPRRRGAFSVALRGRARRAAAHGRRPRTGIGRGTHRGHDRQPPRRPGAAAGRALGRRASFSATYVEGACGPQKGARRPRGVSRARNLRHGGGFRGRDRPAEKSRASSELKPRPPPVRVPPRADPLGKYLGQRGRRRRRPCGLAEGGPRGAIRPSGPVERRARLRGVPQPIVLGGVLGAWRPIFGKASTRAGTWARDPLGWRPPSAHVAPTPGTSSRTSSFRRASKRKIPPGRKESGPLPKPERGPPGGRGHGGHTQFMPNELPARFGGRDGDRKKRGKKRGRAGDIWNSIPERAGLGRRNYLRERQRLAAPAKGPGGVEVASAGQAGLRTSNASSGLPLLGLGGRAPRRAGRRPAGGPAPGRRRGATLFLPAGARGAGLSLVTGELRRHQGLQNSSRTATPWGVALARPSASRAAAACAANWPRDARGMPRGTRTGAFGNSRSGSRVWASTDGKIRRQDRLDDPPRRCAGSSCRAA